MNEKITRFLIYIKENIKDIIILILLLGIIAILIFDLFKTDKDEENGQELMAINEIEPISHEEINETFEKIKVDIKGYVKKPGVYELDNGSIVNDLIKLAGGLKSGGTTSNINLSKKLNNETVVIIYSTNELKKISQTLVDSINCPEVDINECTADKKTSVINGNTDNSTNTDNSSNASSSNDNQNNSNASNNNSNSNNSDNTTKSNKININTAGIADLMTLSGIGESKANAIINYRKENGNFKQIEDIMQISGIGEASFAKIKDFITV